MPIKDVAHGLDTVRAAMGYRATVHRAWSAEQPQASSANARQRWLRWGGGVPRYLGKSVAKELSSSSPPGLSCLVILGTSLRPSLRSER